MFNSSIKKFFGICAENKKSINLLTSHNLLRMNINNKNLFNTKSFNFSTGKTTIELIKILRAETSKLINKFHNKLKTAH